MTPAQTPQIQGLPPGAIVGPPLTAQSAPAQGTTGAQVSGLPPGAIVGPPLQQQQQDQTQEAPPDNTDPRAAIGSGFVKAAGQTVNTVSKALHAIPGVGETLAPQQGIDAASSMEKTKGLGEGVGATLENVLEFVSGDEALKALPIAARLKELSGVAEFISAHPYLAKFFGTGARQAAVSGAQTLAHGGTPGEAGVAAGGAGLLGGALEAGGSAVSDAIANKGAQVTAAEQAKNAVTSANVAGEDIPKLAPGANPSPEVAAQVKSAQQAGSQKAIKNLATQAANKTLSKFGEVSPGADSFGDAAKQIQAKAQPVFKKLDALSDNEYTGLRGQMDAATKVMKNPGSYEAYVQAESKLKDGMNRLEDLFNKHADAIGPQDLANARSAWRDSMTLQKVHSAVEGAFSVPEDVASTSSAERTLSGNKLRGRLNTMLNRIPKADLERTVGKAGVSNLYDLAEINSTPAQAQKFDEVVGNLQQGLQKIGKQAGTHYLGEGTVGLGKLGYQAVLDRMTVDPAFGKQLASAVKMKASPEIYVPVLVSAFQQAAKASRESSTEQ